MTLSLPLTTNGGGEEDLIILAYFKFWFVEKLFGDPDKRRLASCQIGFLFFSTRVICFVSCEPSAPMVALKMHGYIYVGINASEASLLVMEEWG